MEEAGRGRLGVDRAGRRHQWAGRRGRRRGRAVRGAAGGDEGGRSIGRGGRGRRGRGWELWRARRGGPGARAPGGARGGGGGEHSGGEVLGRGARAYGLDGGRWPGTKWRADGRAARRRRGWKKLGEQESGAPRNEELEAWAPAEEAGSGMKLHKQGSEQKRERSREAGAAMAGKLDQGTLRERDGDGLGTERCRKEISSVRKNLKDYVRVQGKKKQLGCARFLSRAWEEAKNLLGTAARVRQALDGRMRSWTTMPTTMRRRTPAAGAEVTWLSAASRRRAAIPCWRRLGFAGVLGRARGGGGGRVVVGADAEVSNREDKVEGEFWSSWAGDGKVNAVNRKGYGPFLEKNIK
jgi:hypothetical protein